MKARRKKILDILTRGKHVRFTNVYNGVTKDVKKWNPDDGDLKAYRIGGGATVKDVCWRTDQYDIEEIEPPTDT